MKQLALLALLLAPQAVNSVCAAPATGAKSQAVSIKTLVLARDYKGGKAVGIAKTFKPANKKIHCVVGLNRVATVTAKAAWYAVDAAGLRNFKIVEASLPRQLADQLHFNASLPRPWPVGKYRVDVYINGKLARSVPYTIAK